MEMSGEQHNIKFTIKNHVLPLFNNREFLSSIQKQIVGLLKTDDLTLSDLLSRLHNCDPLVTKKGIEDLISNEIVNYNPRKKQYSIKKSLDVGLSKSSDDPLDGYRNKDFLTKLPFANDQKTSDIIQAIKKNLPEASPVYFQWWFEDSSLPLLSSAILSRISNSERIALIGAPTLGAYVSHFIKNRIVIFDVDETLLNNLKSEAKNNSDLIRYDVVSNLNKDFQNNFNIVYLDPPWYVDYILTFLKRASELCKRGGLVFISLPPVNTRPTIYQERKRIYKFIKDYKFKIISYWPSAIKYEVPKFEARAYEQSGVKLKQPWREGDLLLLRKTGDVINADFLELQVEQNSWSEFIINECRLFLKETTCSTENSSISLISKPSGYDSFYLKTTSLRESARKMADIISSRNHAALVKNKKIAKEMLDALSKKRELTKIEQEIFIRYKSSKREIAEAIATLTSFTQSEEPDEKAKHL
ncbi:MAG: bis-aminopropyl spermidine synthase family protein [Acidobacteriota bacterium]|nr:bis-aminopropyl spermidine synthase family protein [Acidobacteriota bacterium]